ncbi:MAG TPA: hypothetical protein EYQ31_03365, partial [Candidatus Handelsmanbacteria bacterium]|nr:hypothetical protein [Candidatus Handelsmanbacteria bacterium]
MGRTHMSGPTRNVILLALLLLADAVSAEQLELSRALQIASDRSPTIQGARQNLEISHRNLQAQRAALKSRFGLVVTPYEFAKDRVFNDLLSAHNTQEQTHIGASFSIQQPIEMTDATLSMIQSVDWREASSSLASSLGGRSSQQSYSSNLYLQYSQPLFTYNRTRLTLERLELALENARLDYAIQRLQIESGVTRLFLDLYLKQRNVAISREELVNANERYEIIEGKVLAGISAREELLQEDLTRANAQASLESIQLQYANALDDFRVQLGLPFEMELSVTRVANCQMEPRAAVAWHDAETGRTTLYAGSQGANRLKMHLAPALNVAPELVRVITEDVGGGYGPRNALYPEFVLISWAAKRLGRPVKWTSERTEAFVADYQGRDLLTQASLALDSGGKFLAMRTRMIGAVGGHTVAYVSLNNGFRLTTSLYDIPAAHAHIQGVLTNTPSTSPYRGAGRPEAMFVIERLIDKAA